MLALPRLAERAIPDTGGEMGAAEPPGWGWRGAEVPDIPLPAAMLVWTLLFTVPDV